MKQKNKQTHQSHYHAYLVRKGFKYPTAFNRIKTMKQIKKFKMGFVRAVGRTIKLNKI